MSHMTSTRVVFAKWLVDVRSSSSSTSPLPISKLGTVTTSPSLNPHLTTSSTPAMGVNLHFSFDVESHAVDSNIIFISVNTPTKTHGLGAGKTADLTYA
ncbi:UDP-glucose 6-dehydrogenase 4 [Acorus gramineus]|uniref:UDP-glucose 6-dehydrogenase 4 n=1 Tax=Acorus gramineus TaxID=55184 RepID=A0AAV9ANY3_ACOGR|nr:UDP-glucose 6-dehydrogenase 4 [Acorus gramineus]